MRVQITLTRYCEELAGTKKRLRRLLRRQAAHAGARTGGGVTAGRRRGYREPSPSPWEVQFVQAKIFTVKRKIESLVDRIVAVVGYWALMKKEYRRVYLDILSTRQGSYYYVMRERGLAAHRMAAQMGGALPPGVPTEAELLEKAVRGPPEVPGSEEEGGPSPGPLRGPERDRFVLQTIHYLIRRKEIEFIESGPRPGEPGEELYDKLPGLLTCHLVDMHWEL